ncbi:BLUF domain-containing protein [Methylobacterium sp. Leaf89]|uniref:BLUF domain-containing protein n=1 Tax=Methylobacterium sp. Leaf89 TaxID=1736245 RepID=UPI0006FF8745|nr:BLUF domain-containing protein [Methylobacterium sp. Leaf89]KQO70982.1 blue light sensor protein [Methylobacterium sp. Leaf89]
MSDLYRLVYASKNLLQVPDAEASHAVAQILETSQRNNAEVGVTGALMFNGGAFAQVLEGPRQGVERTFERIQRDQRHGDVTVLECGPTEARGFANWSMAFVGQAETGQTLWSDLARESGFDLSRLDGDAVFRMLHGLVIEEEGIPASAPVPVDPGTTDAPAAAPAPDRTGLDVDRLRAEVADLRPVNPPGPAGHPAASDHAALVVLREALAQERRRTTALREEIDDLRIARTQDSAAVEALRQERDIWVERARCLASALCREAEAVRRSPDAPVVAASVRAA